VIELHLARLDPAFRRCLGRFDRKQRKALVEITPGAAALLIRAGRPPADFFEQVEYNGRRLAKLNVSPAQVLRALGVYDRLLDPLLPKAAFSPAREQLRSAIVLTLNNAFYQVREQEAQTFFDLFHAELEAVDLRELMQRFADILGRTFRADAARLTLLAEDRPKGIAKRRFVAARDPAERLILDEEMRGKHASYWSVPFFAGGRIAGVIQLGFATRYEWLPRELQLLEAVAERCLAAAEKARLAQDLAAREGVVRELAAHMFQVEEEERRRISRELHDEAGQSLLFIRLQLEMLERAAPADWKPRARLAETRAVVEHTILEIRRILAALSPAVLEQLGLAAAIRQLTARFRKLCQAKVDLRIAVASRLRANVEAVAYRLIQECYHNIAKHAGASHVKVSVRSTDRILELRVEDDGVGFDVNAATAKRQSFGLAGMRERVALMGGSFDIRSQPGRGTRISITLPAA
jgi:signal transduction histidine kinase